MPSNTTQGQPLTDLLLLVERLPVAAAVNAFDESESVITVNDAFVRTFGYQLSDIPTVGDWAIRAYPDETYRKETFRVWDTAVKKARAETGRVEAMEFRVTCADGTARDVVFGAAVTGNFLMVTLIDVSALRHAEAQVRALQHSRERTAYELTENIPVGTYTMVQPPGGGMASFGFMSRRFLDLCGLDADEARSDPFKAFACVHPDDYDDWVMKNAEVFALKLPFRGECRVVVGGDVRWITAESQPRDLPDGSVVWEGVLTDITRQKEAEAALAEAREMERAKEQTHRLQLEQKLRSSLTAAATAHEIKQPLSRILLATQLTLKRYRQQSLDATEMLPYLENMLTDSQALVDTIDRMRLLLRNVRSTQHDASLAAVIQSALLYSRPLLEQEGVVVHSLSFDEDVHVVFDAVQIQTAVINLIRNAVEAVSQLPANRRRIMISMASAADTCRIVVEDSGPGMPDDQLASAPLTTTKPAGTGLGLYLARTAMENHGGRVEIDRSRLGGAEVCLVFPLGRSATHEKE